MKQTETKTFPFVLSKMDEELGVFTGYASIWDVIDSFGDSVAKGAFKKTLKEGGSFPMLWSHNIDEPIGVIGGREDKTGLYVEGRLNLDVQRAREVRSLMKQGAVTGLSIGYQTMKEDVDRENATRILKEIKLWEISPCVFQACPGAVIEDVKAEDSMTSQDDISVPVKEPEKSTPEIKPETLHLIDVTTAQINLYLESKRR